MKKESDKDYPWFKYYKDMRAHIDYPDVSMYEMVKRTAKKYPSNIAYKYYGNDPAISGISLSPVAGTVVAANTPTTITLTATVAADAKDPYLCHNFKLTTTNGQVITYTNAKVISENGGRVWSDISGATSPSYTTAATTASMNNTYYRCRVVYR